MVRAGAAFWYALVNFVDDDGPQRAGHIAFASLFAIFPFLIFLVALAGFIGQTAARVTEVVDAAPSAPVQRHPNGTIGLDHVVVASTDLDRTTASG